MFPSFCFIHVYLIFPFMDGWVCLDACAWLSPVGQRRPSFLGVRSTGSWLWVFSHSTPVRLRVLGFLILSFFSWVGRIRYLCAVFALMTLFFVAVECCDVVTWVGHPDSSSDDPTGGHRLIVCMVMMHSRLKPFGLLHLIWPPSSGFASWPVRLALRSSFLVVPAREASISSVYY